MGSSRLGIKQQIYAEYMESDGTIYLWRTCTNEIEEYFILVTA